MFSKDELSIELFWHGVRIKSLKWIFSLKVKSVFNSICQQTHEVSTSNKKIIVAKIKTFWIFD